MSESELLRTALHGRHVSAGAKLAGEAGWEMPLSYRGALEEVGEARRRAGVADVSHLGRIRIRGDGALDLLERLCTCDVVHQEDDTALLTTLCNERGGVIDAGFIVRLESFWVLTCDAGNRGKVLAHLESHAAQFDAKVDDQTPKTSMIAAFGPTAPEMLDRVLPIRVSHMPRGAAKTGSLLIARYIATRTSYAGLWGLEVMVPNMMAGQAWGFITQKAGENAIPPVGLAARDVLRIEAGLPRYGHELNETIDPITAGLGRAVDFGHDFLGVEALAKVRGSGPARRRVGLVLTTGATALKGEPCAESIPKLGAVVCRTDGGEVGAVTSGTFSPTLERTIAMAYLTPDLAHAGAEVLVEVAGEQRPRPRSCSCRLSVGP